MIKKKIVVLIISFFLLFSNLNVYAIVGVSDKYFVNDYANLLSNNTEEYIVNCSSFLKENVNSEIVVVTVNNLENISIEEYSDTLYEQYNIGYYTDNKSILILVSLEERTVRVKVGSGLSNYFTDNLINSYIDDYFAPYFKENNWEYGIKNGFSAFCKTICDIYGVDADSMIVENGGTFFYEYKVEILIFGILFVMFSCNYFTKFLVRKYKDKISTEYYEEALFYIVVMIDSFIFYYYLVFDIKYFLILLGFFVVSIIGCVDFDNTKKKKKKKLKRKRVSNMKKIFFGLSLIFIYFFGFISVGALVEPTNNFYVNDYANILSNETEEHILKHSVDLERNTKAQIVVVTVPNLEGRSLEIYATELFRSFGIGDSKENNGLLLLLALEERKFRVEVGYGLEDVLPDGLTGRYQDEYIIPYLKNNQWNEGIINGYNAFYKKICEHYGIDSSDVSVNTDNSTNVDTDLIIPCVGISVIFAGILAYLCSFWKIKKKRKKVKNYILLQSFYVFVVWFFF